jgi:hypothetical protein
MRHSVANEGGYKAGITWEQDGKMLPDLKENLEGILKTRNQPERKPGRNPEKGLKGGQNMGAT